MNMLSWFYTLRSYLDSYLGFLKGTRFWSLIWVVAICVIVWFYGESIAFGSWRPLESEFRRIVAVGVIVAGWLIYLIVSFFRKRRAEKALINELTDDGEIDPQAVARDDVAQLRSNLKDALLKMRSISKKRFNFVYDFPWYMIIGSPGSGKTTALLNSGLKFPLGDDIDGEAVKGVGGTRNCDWWFTDDAIMIDTAGRYTTHSSDAIVDSVGWQGFLGMLKKHRPLKPVNGIIITLSIEEVLAKSPQARIKEIRTVRQRLRDLEDNLKVRLPVYLLFTKIDMIAGFSEFFDGFNKFDREQVLGTTFPLGVSQSKGKMADAFATQYKLILDRLNRLLIERMQQEPDDIRRGRVFRFPAQFAAIETSLLEIVSELTATSKLVSAPLLRGIYFVSATQPGQVYDRTRSSVSERFAFLPDSTTSGPLGQKAFFLNRLFSDVIFGEANLVTTDRRVGRRRAFLIGTLYAIPFLASVALATGWAHAWFSNKTTLQAVNEKIAAYNRDVSGIKIEGVTSADIVSVIEPLNNLRTALYEDVPGTDKWYHLGIAQEDKISESLDASYQRGLNGLLLPRLLVYLQEGMDKQGISASVLYSRLKLYLMLGGLGPMDKAYVQEFLAADFEVQLPGAGRAKLREDLLKHVLDLVSKGNQTNITLDQALIDEARKELAAELPSVRIYEIVRELPKAKALPEWRASEKAGSGGELLLERASGVNLREGIPGIFTNNGFNKVMLPEFARVAREFQSEPWVLGENYIAGQTLEDLKLEVLRQYFQEHQKKWAELLQDIRIREVADIQQAASVVGILTSKNNPLLGLAKAIASDSDVRPTSAQPALIEAVTESNAEGLTEKAKVAAEEATKELLENAPAATAQSASPDLYLLDQLGINDLAPYAALGEYVQPKGENPADAAALGDVFEELYRQLSRAATNPGEVNSMFGVDSALAAANQRVITEAQRLPNPFDRWLGKLATDIAKLTASGARRSISELWETTGGRFCRTAVANRYPFQRDAENDVAINDFTRMFGPSGEFSNFFDLHLKPFVDVSQSPWKWTGLAGNDALASDALVQFEYAKRIQTAFFAEGSGLSVNLDVTPVELDNESTDVLLSLNDQSITYDHGPVQTKSLNWPGDGNRAARIVFQPPGNNVSVSKTGPWAMFRLFDLADRKLLGDDKFRASFLVGKRGATFDVQVGSVLNPFSLPEISKFQCPERL
jgi:type VI secretion system protein ImpL